MAWIRTIPPSEATGALASTYAAAVARAGRVYQILQAMSLAPAVLEASIGFYLRVMHGPPGLERRQRELLAVVVSRSNRCHY
jgi:alkylhydroperoxidase family enzyme